jgi:hypothetical protein
MFVRDAESAYVFGLWCADGYWWSSSIGLSNTNPELILRFGRFLQKESSPERLKLRVYQVQAADQRILDLVQKASVKPPSKMKHTAYHLYINSRPLIRNFLATRKLLEQIPKEYVNSYFAGRFDGDGSFGDTPRIVYTTQNEAEIDSRLLLSAGISETSIYHYKKANEFCIYIHRSAWTRFENLLKQDSWKINNPNTL